MVPAGSPSGESATAVVVTARTQPLYLTFQVTPFNFRVVASPLVPFDVDNNLGDIFLLSSGNVGFYMVDEEPQTVEWREENVDVVKVKIRERYGFAVAHEGQGVGVFKNVFAGRNYWDGDIRAHVDMVRCLHWRCVPT